MKPWRHTKWKNQYWVYMDGSSRIGIGPDAQFDDQIPFVQDQKSFDMVWMVTELNPKTHIAWEETASEENKIAQQLAFRNKYLNKKTIPKSQQQQQKKEKTSLPLWKNKFSYNDLFLSK
jgi:hypothetical protein